MLSPEHRVSAGGIQAGADCGPSCTWLTAAGVPLLPLDEDFVGCGWGLHSSLCGLGLSVMASGGQVFVMSRGGQSQDSVQAGLRTGAPSPETAVC